MSLAVSACGDAASAAFLLQTVEGKLAMKGKMLGIGVIVALTLAACATPEVLQATGGSRADGTVSLSFEYGLFQKPVVDWNQANATAAQRCAAWGYSSADRFGGVINRCEQYNQYGCILTLVTVNYQCTGHPSS